MSLAAINALSAPAPAAPAIAYPGNGASPTKSGASPVSFARVLERRQADQADPDSTSDGKPGTGTADPDLGGATGEALAAGASALPTDPLPAAPAPDAMAAAVDQGLTAVLALIGGAAAAVPTQPASIGGSAAAAVQSASISAATAGGSSTTIATQPFAPIGPSQVTAGPAVADATQVPVADGGSPTTRQPVGDKDIASLMTSLRASFAKPAAAIVTPDAADAASVTPTVPDSPGAPSAATPAPQAVPPSAPFAVAAVAAGSPTVVPEVVPDALPPAFQPPIPSVAQRPETTTLPGEPPSQTDQPLTQALALPPALPSEPSAPQVAPSLTPAPVQLPETAAQPDRPSPQTALPLAPELVAQAGPAPLTAPHSSPRIPRADGTGDAPAAKHVHADRTASTIDLAAPAAAEPNAATPADPGSPAPTVGQSTAPSATSDTATPVATGPSQADQSVARHLDLARDNQWLDRLAHDITQAATTNSHLKFQLNPEHLGSLQVEIVNSAAGTSVRMTADNDAARAIIADAQPRLMAEVRAQGLRIAESHVDLGNQAGSGSAAGGQRQSSEDHKPFVRTQAEIRGETSDSARPADDDLYA